MRRIALLVLSSLLLAAVPGQALWKTLKTPAFTLFYPQGQEEQALEVLATLEDRSPHVERTLGYRPRRVSVVLMDVGIESNGLTDPVFRRIVLYPFSPGGESSGSLRTVQSWWRLVWVHEYSHWVHLDMAAGLPRAAKTVFGNILAPNLFAPTWLLEGVCVYVESAGSAYEGRLNDGTFAAYVATLARAKALPSIAAATFQSSEFPGGTGPYLYGGMFLGYLVDTYGEEALREFLDSTSSSALSYLSPLVPAAGLDRSARRAFGKSLAALWRQWGEAEERRAAEFRTPQATLSGHPGWLEAPTAWGGYLFYRRSRPVDSRPLETRWVHELLRLDPESGEEKVLVRSPGGFTGPLVIRDGTLYYALLDLGRGFANTELASYGFLAQVWALDLETARRRQLFRAPIRTFGVLSDGDVLCSRDRARSFGSELTLYRRGSRTLQFLFETDYLVNEIVSGEEGTFVSARRDGESFGVYQVRSSGWLPGAAGPGEAAGLSGEALAGALAAGALSPGQLHLEPILSGPFSQGRLCLAGGRLYFSANPDGHYRVYGRELASGRTGVSASLGYQDAPAFDPAAGRLYALSLEPGGYALCELPDPLGKDSAASAEDLEPEQRAVRGPLPHEAPLRTPEGPQPPAAAAGDEARPGGYLDNLGTLLPRALLPLVAFDTATGNLQAGASLLGRSALGDLQYHLSVFYDSESRRAELDTALQFQPAFPLQAELAFGTLGTDSLRLTLQSPLVRSLTPGLWYLSVGVTARLFDLGLSRFEIAPFLGLGLRGPFTELGLQARLPVESQVLGSDRDALALIAGMDLVQLAGLLQLGIQIVGVSSFDGSAWRLPVLPAYAQGLAATVGAAARLDLWLPVLRIRRGLWNPGFYLEDLYLAAFSEAALNQSLALQVSFGGELHLELRAFAAATGVPADLFLRVAVTREGQPGITVGLETYGLEDYIRNGHKEVSRP